MSPRTAGRLMPDKMNTGRDVSFLLLGRRPSPFQRERFGKEFCGASSNVPDQPFVKKGQSSPCEQVWRLRFAKHERRHESGRQHDRTRCCGSNWLPLWNVRGCPRGDSQEGSGRLGHDPRRTGDHGERVDAFSSAVSGSIRSATGTVHRAPKQQRDTTNCPRCDGAVGSFVAG